jgi:multicomponent Na+:H+ antiporter subunit E
MKIFYLFEFMFVYFWELTKSNFIVAFEALKPKFGMKPGFVEIPLDVTNDDAILLLANLITMTPGTVTIDVSDDKKFLYAHALFAPNSETVRNDIKKVLEDRVERLFK